jgi:hypothetical protein
MAMKAAARELAQKLGLPDDVAESGIDVLQGNAAYINTTAHTWMLDRKYGKGNWSVSVRFPTPEEHESALKSLGNPEKLSVMIGVLRVKSGGGYVEYTDIGTSSPSKMPGGYLKWEDQGLEIASTRAQTRVMELADAKGLGFDGEEYDPGNGPGDAQSYIDTVAIQRGIDRLTQHIAELTTSYAVAYNPPPTARNSKKEEEAPETVNAADLIKEIRGDLIPRLSEINRGMADGIELMLQGKKPEKPPSTQNLTACLDHFLGKMSPENIRLGGWIKKEEERLAEEKQGPVEQ